MIRWPTDAFLPNVSAPTTRGACVLELSTDVKNPVDNGCPGAEGLALSTDLRAPNDRVRAKWRRHAMTEYVENPPVMRRLSTGPEISHGEDEQLMRKTGGEGDLCYSGLRPPLIFIRRPKK